jgi:hypothetical protein
MVLDLWFNQTRPGEVFDKVALRTDFTGHCGKNTSTNPFEQVRASATKGTTPDIHFDIKRLVAQGDSCYDACDVQLSIL